MFGKKLRLYLDAAAATPLSSEARERLLELLDVYGNPGAIHAEGLAASNALEVIRKEAADAIGAHSDEIVFTSSGTESNNLAIKGSLNMYGSGAHAITSLIEHPSVLEPLLEMERRGAQISYLSVDSEGLVDSEALKRSITSKTVLVSIGLINSEIGVLQDYKTLAKAVRAEKKKRKDDSSILFHIDAAQAPLWMNLKVEAIGCDLMTLDAQKILGPKGVGLLYVKRGVKLTSEMRGGGQESGLRSGTQNVPLAGAFARALSLAQENCESNAKAISVLRDDLWREIKKVIPDAVVNGSLERRVPNNLNISIPGLIGERAVIALSAYGIASSTRSSCATKDEDLSHVILALGFGESRAREAIRFTFLPDAKHLDISSIVAGLRKAADTYKNIDSAL